MYIDARPSGQSGKQIKRTIVYFDKWGRNRDISDNKSEKIVIILEISMKRRENGIIEFAFALCLGYAVKCQK